MAECIRATLLCVDDEPALLCSIATVLERSGYQVVCAASGAEALQRLRNGFEINAVILDHFLPDRTGTEVAAEIKRLKPDLPIILSTGDWNVSVATAAVSAVAHKPCHPQELLRIVADVLRRSAA